jgi:predicted PP-loop superfamily ATPase
LRPSAAFGLFPRPSPEIGCVWRRLDENGKALERRYRRIEPLKVTQRTEDDALPDARAREQAKHFDAPVAFSGGADSIPLAENPNAAKRRRRRTRRWGCTKTEAMPRSQAA